MEEKRTERSFSQFSFPVFNFNYKTEPFFLLYFMFSKICILNIEKECAVFIQILQNGNKVNTFSFIIKSEK